MNAINNDRMHSNTPMATRAICWPLAMTIGFDSGDDDQHWSLATTTHRYSTLNEVNPEWIMFSN